MNGEDEGKGQSSKQRTRISHPFRWIPEFIVLVHRRSRSQASLYGSAVLVGIVAGLAAVLFIIAGQFVTRVSLDQIAGYRPDGPVGEAKVAWIGESTSSFRPWLLLIVPTVGGLISGLLVFTFAPEAEGHGTDSVIDAYHNRDGLIRGRVPVVKLIASALTIGTGGSGGREGPIAQIGAGFGSVLARVLRLRPSERRILVAAGMGAGVAAIFRAPLAGALFASEVLYSSPEFEPEVLLPAGVASTVAYSTFGLFFGWQPLFATPELSFQDVRQLGPYTVLAILMAALAMIYSRSFATFTALFHELGLSKKLKPALGAFLTAVIALCLFFAFDHNHHVLNVMSFGYGILQSMLTDPTQLSASLLFAIALGKIVTTSLTIGSGGSGGVFGPSMVIGGCGGGAVGLLFHQWWPALVPQPASFMVVGMAGFFAAAAKTPFSTLVIVCELTGDYRLILPALWVCTLSYLLSDEQSIYSSQVEGRMDSPAHQGLLIRRLLTGQTIASILTDDHTLAPLRTSDALDSIIERFEKTSLVVLPVVDEQQKLAGVIHLHDLHWTANRRGNLKWLVAADLMQTIRRPLAPSDRLDQAIELFTQCDLPELPVVGDQDRSGFVGMIRRSDVAKLYLRRIRSRDNE